MKNKVNILLLLLSFSSHIFCDGFLRKTDLIRKLLRKMDLIRRIDDYSLSNIQSDDLRLLSRYCEGRRVCIATLEDKCGNKFILKQMMNSIFAAIKEKLVSHIAYLVKIPANQVKIIPWDISFIGKGIAKFPATLHTFAPGVPAKYLPEHLRKYSFSLKQVVNEKSSKKILGFNRTIVSRMSLHDDLPEIVALDTFFANKGRHANNFFYDEESDHFCAIDFESSLRKDLVANVYKFFSAIAEDKNSDFSREEIKGLVIYRDMLKKLVDTYNPKFLSSLMDELIKFSKIELIENCKEEKKLYNDMLIDNHTICIKIVQVLDIILKNNAHKVAPDIIVMPDTDTVMPDTDTVMPDTDTVMPDTDTVMPDIDTVIPDTALTLDTDTVVISDK